MNIAFLVHKTTVFRNISYLVDECLKTKCRVIIFYDPRFNSEVRSFQNFQPKDLPKFRYGEPELIEFDFDNLAGLCRQNKVDCMVTNEGYHIFYQIGRLGLLSEIRKSGTKVVSLNDCLDIVIWPLQALEYFDKTYYISDFVRNLHFEYAVRWGKKEGCSKEELIDKYRGKYEVVGSVAWDQLRGAVDSAAIKRKYNLPENKKIILFASQSILDVGYWHLIVWGSSSKLRRSFLALKYRRPQYLRDAWFAPSYEEITRAIKEFSKRNDAVFVIKNRKKCPQFDYLRKLADIYIDGFDDEYYPLFTIFQLLSVSDLCISNYSLSLVEALIKNIPGLCIHSGPLHDFAGEDRVYLRYNELVYNDRADTIFNYPKCIYNIHHRKFTKWLLDKTLADFKIDSIKRQEYLRRFIEPRDGRLSASERIISSMEQLVNG